MAAPTPPPSTTTPPAEPPQQPAMPSWTELQGLTWRGAVPVELSMKESEVTGLVPPLPHYILLPRTGYLPVAAADAIARFLQGRFAADIQQGPFAARLWFEAAAADNEDGGGGGDGVPLPWHLPGGVLYDLYGPQHPPQREGDLFGSDDEAEGASASASAAASAAALKRGGGGGEGGIVTPWRVTVRFHDIPLDRVLELPVDPSGAREAAMRHFRGRLKQASYLLHGGSGPAMALRKDDEVALWEAVAAGSYHRYCPPAAKLLTETPQRIPLRLLIEGHPALHPSLPSDPYATLTVLEALRRIAPRLFSPPRREGEKGEEEGKASAAFEITCQGLCPPPWDAPLLEAWRALRHADFYLYLTARRRPRMLAATAAVAPVTGGALPG